MTGYCEDCKNKSTCKKSIGFMVGFCNTDFLPISETRTRLVRVLFSDGDSLETEIYGTEGEVLDYYRPGKVFNTGAVNDHLVKVVSAEILEGDCIIMEIYLNCGHWEINGYSIAGNYEDGYTVCETETGEDSETLYYSNDFESCLVWCINS